MRLAAGLCEHAVRPCHDRVCGGGRDRAALAAAACADVVYALVIAVSRVVLAAHYPSDVLAGAVVGACGALLVRDWFAARRLGFVDRRATAACTRCPGPRWARIKRVARSLLAP